MASQAPVAAAAFMDAGTGVAASPIPNLPPAQTTRFLDANCDAGILPNGLQPAQVPVAKTPATLRRSDFVNALVATAAEIIDALYPTPPTAHIPLPTFISEILRRSKSSFSTLQLALFFLFKYRAASLRAAQIDAWKRGLAANAAATAAAAAAAASGTGSVVGSLALIGGEWHETSAEVLARGGLPSPPVGSPDPSAPLTLAMDDTSGAAARPEGTAAALPPPPEPKDADEEAARILPTCGRRLFLTSLILASKYLQDKNYSSRAWARISGLSALEINRNERAFARMLDYGFFVSAAKFARWSALLVEHINAVHRARMDEAGNAAAAVGAAAFPAARGVAHAPTPPPPSHADILSFDFLPPPETPALLQAMPHDVSLPLSALPGSTPGRNGGDAALMYQRAPHSGVPVTTGDGIAHSLLVAPPVLPYMSHTMVAAHVNLRSTLPRAVRGDAPALGTALATLSPENQVARTMSPALGPHPPSSGSVGPQHQHQRHQPQPHHQSVGGGVGMGGGGPSYSTGSGSGGARTPGTTGARAGSGTPNSMSFHPHHHQQQPQSHGSGGSSSGRLAATLHAFPEEPAFEAAAAGAMAAMHPSMAAAAAIQLAQAQAAAAAQPVPPPLLHDANSAPVSIPNFVQNNSWSSRAAAAVAAAAAASAAAASHMQYSAGSSTASASMGSSPSGMSTNLAAAAALNMSIMGTMSTGSLVSVVAGGLPATAVLVDHVYPASPYAAAVPGPLPTRKRSAPGAATPPSVPALSSTSWVPPPSLAPSSSVPPLAAASPTVSTLAPPPKRARTHTAPAGGSSRIAIEALLNSASPRSVEMAGLASPWSKMDVDPLRHHHHSSLLASSNPTAAMDVDVPHDQGSMGLKQSSSSTLSAYSTCTATTPVPVFRCGRTIAMGRIAAGSRCLPSLQLLLHFETPGIMMTAICA